jgi:hypothetical protein
MTAIEELELTLEPTRLVSEGRVNSRPGTARNSREVGFLQKERQ